MASPVDAPSPGVSQGVKRLRLGQSGPLPPSPDAVPSSQPEELVTTPTRAVSEIPQNTLLPITVDHLAFTEVPDVREPGDTVYMAILGPMKADAELYTPASMIKLAADLIGGMVTFGFKPLNFALARFALADVRDEWALSQQLQSGFKGSTFPSTARHSEAGKFPCGLWWRDNLEKRDKRDPPLLPNENVQTRMLDDKSFLWASPLAACWPLPLSIGPGKSWGQYWMFKIKEGVPDRTLLATLEEELGRKFYGGFFAM